MNSIHITKNKDIMKGIIDGDHQVLTSFYNRNLPVIQRMVFKYHGSMEDVEDIFQEAMIVLYHQLRYTKLEFPKASIHSYFIGVCKNIWRSQQRKRRPLEHLELIEHQTKDTTASIEDQITKNDQKRLLYKHVNGLTNSHKDVLLLIFEGKSTKDIARITGCTEGYTRKKRALSRKSLLQNIFRDPLFLELQEYPNKVLWN